MAKYQTGDLFAVPLAGGSYVTGRIMLDVKQQCIKPKLITGESPMAFYSGTVLVEIYRETTAEPTAQRSEVLIPGIYIDPEPLKDGAWSIIGHIDVDPQTVEFPESVNPFNTTINLTRGEVSLPLGPGIDEWRGISIPQAINSPYLLPDTCLFYLGQTDKIDPRKLKAAQLTDRDLRFNERRTEVYEALGLAPEQPYYQFALQHGFDTARFYEPAKKKK